MKKLRLKFHYRKGIKHIKRLENLQLSKANHDKTKELIENTINKKMYRFRVFQLLKYPLSLICMVILTAILLMIFANTPIALYMLLGSGLVSVVLMIFGCMVRSKQKTVLRDLCAQVNKETGGEVTLSFCFKDRLINRKSITFTDMAEKRGQNFIIIQVNNAHRIYYRKQSEDVKTQTTAKWDGEDLSYNQSNTFQEKNDLIDSLL